MTLLPPGDNRLYPSSPVEYRSPPPGVTQRSGPWRLWKRRGPLLPNPHTLAVSGSSLSWWRPPPLPLSLHWLPGDLGKSLLLRESSYLSTSTSSLSYIEYWSLVLFILAVQRCTVVVGYCERKHIHNQSQCRIYSFIYPPILQYLLSIYHSQTMCQKGK